MSQTHSEAYAYAMKIMFKNYEAVLRSFWVFMEYYLHIWPQERKNEIKRWCSSGESRLNSTKPKWAIGVFIMLMNPVIKGFLILNEAYWASSALVMQQVDEQIKRWCEGSFRSKHKGP